MSLHPYSLSLSPHRPSRSWTRHDLAWLRPLVAVGGLLTLAGSTSLGACLATWATVVQKTIMVVFGD
jgi:hypothetical protein